MPSDATDRRPAFWYGLPHGYVRIDLDPPLESLIELVRQAAALPDGERERVDEVLRFYAATVQALNAQQVQSCAMGMHPDDAGGLATSVLTVSTVAASGGNAKLVVAGLAGSAADAPDTGLRPLQLPVGLAYLAEEKRRTIAPGPPPEGSEGPRYEQIWQGTIAVPAPGNRDIVMLQLVTSAVALADDYRNVLVGIAHTLSFTDPTEDRATGPDGTSSDGTPPNSAAAAVHDDFG
ncbi:hypothetical protein P8605_29600 [Streptomyces sp. T-3]|nr:hypothetical protein [Streptomyces sp. T-3]